MTHQFGDWLMFIGGDMVASQSDEWINSVNPANEEQIGRVPSASTDDIRAAVAAAKAA